MRCENCGKRLPEDAHFCTNCGSPVGGPSRVAGLVEIAGIAASLRPEGTADVPEIPEPAEPPPMEGAAPAEPASIPEPALLPGEQRPDIAVPIPSISTASHQSQLRKAAEILARRTQAEIREAEGRPEHLGLAEEAEQDRTPPAEEPPQLAPPPPPAPDEHQGRHVGMGERDLSARMYQRRPGATVEQKSEESTQKSNWCGCGCFVLALLFIITLLVIIYLSSGEPPPESASAAITGRPEPIVVGILGGTAALRYRTDEQCNATGDTGL